MMLPAERARHVFDPTDYVHVKVDIRNPKKPFVTSIPHSYQEPSTGMEIVVPRDFRCDFASFPRILWMILPRVGRYSRAALYHDWMYCSQQVTRFRADSIFRSLLVIDGVPYYQRVLFFLSLRLFGGRVWKRYHASK